MFRNGSSNLFRQSDCLSLDIWSRGCRRVIIMSCTNNWGASNSKKGVIWEHDEIYAVGLCLYDYLDLIFSMIQKNYT